MQKQLYDLQSRKKIFHICIKHNCNVLFTELNYLQQKISSLLDHPLCEVIPVL
jgi:hypothetical protein